MPSEYDKINRRIDAQTSSVGSILAQSMAPLAQHMAQSNSFSQTVSKSLFAATGRDPNSAEGKAFMAGAGGQIGHMITEAANQYLPGMNIGSPQSLANSITGVVSTTGLGYVGGSGVGAGNIAAGSLGEFTGQMAFQLSQGMKSRFYNDDGTGKSNLGGGNFTSLGVILEEMGGRGAFDEDTVIRSYDWANTKGAEFEKAKALELKRSAGDQKAIDYINTIQPGSQTFSIDSKGMESVIDKVETVHKMAMSYSGAIGANTELGRPYAAHEAMRKIEQLTGANMTTKEGILSAGAYLEKASGLAQAQGLPLGSYLQQSETISSVIQDKLMAGGSFARQDDAAKVAQDMMPVLQERAAAVALQKRAMGQKVESPVAMTNMAGMIQREMLGGATDTKAATAATYARQEYKMTDEQETSYQSAMKAYGSAKTDAERKAAESKLEALVYDTTGLTSSSFVNSQTGGVAGVLSSLTGDNAKSLTGAMLDHATAKEGHASIRESVLTMGLPKATGIDADDFTTSYEKLQRNITGSSQKSLIDALAGDKSEADIADIVKSSGATAEGLGMSPEAYANTLFKANQDISKRSQGRTNLGETLNALNKNRARVGNAVDFYNEGSAKRVNEQAEPGLPGSAIDNTSGDPVRAFMKGATGAQASTQRYEGESLTLDEMANLSGGGRQPQYEGGSSANAVAMLSKDDPLSGNLAGLMENLVNGSGMDIGVRQPQIYGGGSSANAVAMIGKDDPLAGLMKNLVNDPGMDIGGGQLPKLRDTLAEGGLAQTGGGQPEVARDLRSSPATAGSVIKVEVVAITADMGERRNLL